MSNLSTWRKLLVLGTAVVLFSCQKEYSGGGTGAPGTGTVGGSPGSCTPATPSGTYTQGVALTVGNTVHVQVNVATVGTYTISTNTVNGVSFSNSGTYTTTGLQNVFLTGTGTPTNSGSHYFTVNFGSSICSFSITFETGTTITDYFPTTISSYWALGLDGGIPSQSFLIKVIPYALTAGGNTYSTFTLDNFWAAGSDDSLYYRKAGGDYFEYFNTKARFFLDGPGTPTNEEYIFLKDNVPQGTTWNSPNITGTTGGISYTHYIKMTILEKAVIATSGIVSSTDVIKIRYDYLVTMYPGTPSHTEERWFAKGIGLIYYSNSDGTPPATVYKITSYQVF